jgi:hypothetical protein
MSRWLFIAAIAARRRASQPAADSAAPDSTEPDIITDADTLRRSRWSRRLLGNELLEPHHHPPGSASARRRHREQVRVHARRVGRDSLRWNSVGDAGMIEAVVAVAECSDGCRTRCGRIARDRRAGYNGCAERR